MRARATIGVQHTGINRGDTMHAQHYSDKALVAAYLAGDQRAFSMIVQRYRRQMWALALRYTRNEHDAQDVMQDALLKAAVKMETYRGESGLGTWLCRLVLNAGYDHFKRADNKRRHLSIDDEEKISHDTNRSLSHEPLTHLDRRLALMQVLGKLPAANRSALLLIDVAGLSINHAARELGVRPGTVKSRRYRARDMLLQMIDEDVNLVS